MQFIISLPNHPTNSEVNERRKNRRNKKVSKELKLSDFFFFFLLFRSISFYPPSPSLSLFRSFWDSHLPLCGQLFFYHRKSVISTPLRLMTKEKNGRKVLVNDRRTKSIHAFADISMDNSYQQTKGKARKEEGDIAKKIASSGRVTICTRTWFYLNDRNNAANTLFLPDTTFHRFSLRLFSALVFPSTNAFLR